MQFKRLARTARAFLVVEMSNGQMVDDVRLALDGVRPVDFYNRMGGNAPSADEVMAVVRASAAAYPGKRASREHGEVVHG
jgi:pyruvate/2-oxoacid:ferredoxin oxidoreductase alpha subunit